jgi:hypothetical protein
MVTRIREYDEWLSLPTNGFRYRRMAFATDEWLSSYQKLGTNYLVSMLVLADGLWLPAFASMTNGFREYDEWHSLPTNGFRY